jgi:hypothetical protein
MCGGQLTFNIHDVLGEDGGMLSAITRRYGRKTRAGHALETLGIRGAETEQGKADLDQLGDHPLRDLPNRRAENGNYGRNPCVAEDVLSLG